MISSVYTTGGINPYLARVEYHFEDVHVETRKMLVAGVRAQQAGDALQR